MLTDDLCPLAYGLATKYRVSGSGYAALTAEVTSNVISFVFGITSVWIWLKMAGAVLKLTVALS
jgi:hypothetical protein